MAGAMIDTATAPAQGWQPFETEKLDGRPTRMWVAIRGETFGARSNDRPNWDWSAGVSVETG